MKFTKVAILITMTLVIVSVVPAFAKEGDNQASASIDVASGPGNFDSAVGFTVGFGHELNDGWQIRGDLSYYNFDGPGWASWYDYEYERIPVAASIRKYIPTGLQELTAYAQAGLEISFDSFDWNGYHDDDINIGVPIGGGVEYRLAPEFSVGAGLKYHLVTDDYGIFNVGAAYHF